MQVPADAPQCTIFLLFFCSLVLGQSPDLSEPKSTSKPCTNLFFFRNSAVIYGPLQHPEQPVFRTRQGGLGLAKPRYR
ncbi:hypothetical protein C8F04DRAFT_1137798 [Mycena alexandri]|uniref:Secreted protein n=1 Tax=Mycena alexandri TaxID=1745969 RepID=A0AAD6S9B8_9AGAR|nr:hypothetical protein C8F04DRAFT_1137798 [Mycena alexandri]